MQTKLIILSAVFLLTGCVNQSQIQAKYVKSKNLCRLETGRLFAGSDSLGNSADAQAAVNNSFTECMTKAGWRAPKAGTQVAQTTNPPSGSPSTNPSAAAARQRPAENPPVGAQAQPQATVQPKPQQVAQTQNPPSGAPSTNPSAAAAAKQAPQQMQSQAQPVDALRSRTSSAEFALPGRQPARPPTVPAAPYGTNARKF